MINSVHLPLRCHVEYQGITKALRETMGTKKFEPLRNEGTKA
jgi:hypothetical protein